MISNIFYSFSRGVIAEQICIKEFLRVDNNEYGLYIPLDPFFIVGKLEDGEVKLVEGEQLDRIQSGIEAELEERGLSE